MYYNPNAGPQRYGTDKTPRPPSVFFDGTRLGLEGNMLATLGIGIPAGLHISLSAVLGYAVRIQDGLPAQAKPFTLMGFVFGAILAVIAMAMVLFFLLSIPTMRGFSSAWQALPWSFCWSTLLRAFRCMQVCSAGQRS